MAEGFNSKLTPEECTITAICKAANLGDTLAQDVLEHAGKYLGKAIAIAINLFNLQKVVIAGKITYAEKIFLPAIQRCVNTQVLKEFRQHYPLRCPR
ncbi:MAG: ROK family protein [Candidatus Malihini olakiniferum]